MKLISLNVALFESNNSKLTEFLKQQKPDIICLQEVVREIEESVLPEYITKGPVDKATTDLKHSFYGPNSVMQNFDMEEFHGQESFHFDLGGLAEMGNYTKSKYEVVKGQNIFLENHFTYTTDHSNWPEEDYRAVLVTDLIIDEKPLRILNYHGIWTRGKLGNKKTLAACKKINALALEAKGKVVICGDFNLFPDTPSMKLFETSFVSLVDQFKIKTTRPNANELNNLDRNVVDYIFVSRGVKVNKFEVIQLDVSDHLPLVLNFEI